MAKMKYIVFESIFIDGRVVHDYPFVFPESIAHGAMARALCGDQKPDVASAGFCSLGAIKDNPRKTEPGRPVHEFIHKKDMELGVRWICWDKSVTLNKQSNPDRDQHLLDKHYR